MRKLLIPFSLTFLILQAQPANQFALTIDNIMRGSGLVGFEPSQVRWSGDSQQIYFQWKQASDKEEAPMDTYVAGRDGAAPRKLSDEETKSAPPVFGDTTRDKRLVTYTRDGDLFIYDNSTGKTQQLTKTTDAEVNPRFLADGKRIAFTRANNLYVMSVDNGMLVQLTDVRAAAPAAPAAAPATAAGFGGGGRGGRGGGAAPAVAGETPRGTDSQEYLKKEQKELLETIRERAARREEAEAKRKKDNPRKPFTLQPRQNVTSLQLSPDEKYVVATVVEGAGTAKNTIVPNYVTESAYTEDIPGRSNVGDTQGRARLALIDVASGDVKWVDHGQRTTPPDASSQRMGTEREGAALTVRTPTPQERDVQLGQPVWSEDGTKAVMMARAADNKDRWLLALDPATGKTRVLNTDHDNAWVGGPGSQTLGWMKNDREIYFQSERSGYSHLYAVAVEGGEPRALTSGKWEVVDAALSHDKTRFFLTTSEADPGEHQVYEMSAEGGPRTRLTSGSGSHSAALSPDDQYFADLFSFTNKPPELYVQSVSAGARAVRLTSSPAADFSEYPWLDAPIVNIPSRDGAGLRAQMFKPAHYQRGGPAVIFVHGAGYLQNVHHWWASAYAHEYLFHHLLIERGYLVLNVDYRGSAGYGRDWRTAVYRHMGGTDLNDQIDAARWLVSREGVDAKRIGIYGGSYGGFITLMAMFTQPDVFAAGAALRPVTNWANYNNGYTSNILNTPQKDDQAYRQSSPIYFADGLKGALLICHGMVDTNVHFQDTVELIQRLIELRKENWQVAVYPVENHGFIEPTSWADEYKRILDLFEKNLKPRG